MNSNDKFPLDSFGIDPPEESSTPQSRQKQKLINLVATLVAVDNSRPMQPSAGSLDAIHLKISQRSSMSVKQRLFVWSGWGAAAAITLFVMIRPSFNPVDELTADEAGKSTISRLSLPYQPKDTSLLNSANNDSDHTSSNENNTPSTPHDKSRSMREQQRSLIQKIEHLRNQVALLASRDTERLIAQDGVTWPIIMKLTAPGSDPATAIVQNPILGAMLNQDLRETAGIQDKNLKEASQTSEARPDLTIPSAVPIYDSARDIGQLLVNNLSAPVEGQAYFLWVQSDNAQQPILVGTLPDAIGYSETFDFKLGSTGIIPDQFLITQDAVLYPQVPSSSNTVLHGPNSKKE
jgi:hypothetical protein